MEYDYEPWDWESILSPGTRLDVTDDDRFTEDQIEPAEQFYGDPQIITIVGTGNETIPKDDPHLPEAFAGLPSGIDYCEGLEPSDAATEYPLDIIHLIRPLHNGNARIMAI